jgi:hypothetical protein
MQRGYLKSGAIHFSLDKSTAREAVKREPEGVKLKDLHC